MAHQMTQQQRQTQEMQLALGELHELRDRLEQMAELTHTRITTARESAHRMRADCETIRRKLRDSRKALTNGT